MIQQHTPLRGVIVFSHLQRIFEETGQVPHWSPASPTGLQLRESYQVDDEGGRQNRIAPLPDKLHNHFGVHKTTVMNKVPRGLPVVQAGYVVNAHAAVQLLWVAQDVAQVSHRDSVPDLVRKGRDLEKIVLARAIDLHLRQRIVVYGNTTVVFA